MLKEQILHCTKEVELDIKCCMDLINLTQCISQINAISKFQDIINEVCSVALKHCFVFNIVNVTYS